MLHVSIRSSRYRGPHRTWNRYTRSWPGASPHWDWHYRFLVNGVCIYRSNRFCSWERALESAARQYPKYAAVADLLRGA